MTANDLFAWGALLIVAAACIFGFGKVREKRRQARRAVFLEKFKETRATHDVDRKWRHDHERGRPPKGDA